MVVFELVCVFNRVVREGLPDEVTFEERSEGAEGVCPWQRCGTRQWGVQGSEAGGCLVVGGAARRPVRLRKSECRRHGQRQSGAGSLGPGGTGKTLAFSQSEMGAEMI